MIIDLTQQFLQLLQNEKQSSHIAPSSSSNICVSIQSSLCYKQSSEILHNLQKIEGLLSENKQNYFSNAAYSYYAFNDQQRNEFDKEMKKMIDQISGKIGEMDAVVKGVIFESTTQKQNMANVVICLYQRYRKVSNSFKIFLEFNQHRKTKLQSMLGTQIKEAYKTHKPMPVIAQDLGSRNSEPDPELKRESLEIYEERMSEIKKIEDTKKTLEHINELMDVMENKVLEQELITSSFREIGEVGLFHIEKGNKNLVDANTLAKDSDRMWTIFFLGLAFSLLLLDYLKS